MVKFMLVRPMILYIIDDVGMVNFVTKRFMSIIMSQTAFCIKQLENTAQKILK